MWLTPSSRHLANRITESKNLYTFIFWAVAKEIYSRLFCPLPFCTSTFPAVPETSQCSISMSTPAIFSLLKYLLGWQLQCDVPSPKSHITRSHVFIFPIKLTCITAEKQSKPYYAFDQIFNHICCLFLLTQTFFSTY